MSDDAKPRRKSGDLSQLERQLKGMMDVGAALDDAPAEPKTPPERTPSAAPRSKPLASRDGALNQELDGDDTEVVPTPYGMVPGTTPSKLTITLTAKQHFDYRLIVRAHGTTFSDAIGALARATVASGYVFTEEDLLWLAEQKRR